MADRDTAYRGEYDVDGNWEAVAGYNYPSGGTLGGVETHGSSLWDRGAEMAAADVTQTSGRVSGAYTHKFSLSYSDLNSKAGTNQTGTFEIANIPARGVLKSLFVHVDTAFDGTHATSPNISIGKTTKFQNVIAAANGTLGSTVLGDAISDFGTDVALTFNGGSDSSVSVHDLGYMPAFGAATKLYAMFDYGTNATGGWSLGTAGNATFYLTYWTRP